MIATQTTVHSSDYCWLATSSPSLSLSLSLSRCPHNPASGAGDIRLHLMSTWPRSTLPTLSPLCPPLTQTSVYGNTPSSLIDGSQHLITLRLVSCYRQIPFGISGALSHTARDCAGRPIGLIQQLGFELGAHKQLTAALTVKSLSCVCVCVWSLCVSVSVHV